MFQFQWKNNSFTFHALTKNNSLCWYVMWWSRVGNIQKPFQNPIKEKINQINSHSICWPNKVKQTNKTVINNNDNTTKTAVAELVKIIEIIAPCHWYNNMEHQQLWIYVKLTTNKCVYDAIIRHDNFSILDPTEQYNTKWNKLISYSDMGFDTSVVL